MANAPVETTIEQVVKVEPWTGTDGPMATYEVLFADHGGRTWKVHMPADASPLTDGLPVRGWFNEDKGTFGIAKDRPQNGSQRASSTTTSTGRRDDATGQSIERQTAAKCAAEMAAAVGGLGPVVLANFEELFEAAHRKITGQTEQPDG